MKNDVVEKEFAHLPKHGWIVMSSPMELEAWMEINNQELQSALGSKPAVGYGVCFTLLHGGDVFFHTNSDGDVLLDVTPEASWVVPVIAACTKATVPSGQIWCLPHHDLIPVLWGLNTLIDSSCLVLQHHYRIVRY